MRVLILTPHYPPIIGGAEVFAKALADYLAEKGEEVHVVTGRIDRSLIDGKDNGKITFHRVSLISMKDLVKHSYFYLTTGLPLMFLESIKLILADGIDVIHTVGLTASIIGAIISKLTNKTHISTLQGLGFAKYSIGTSNLLKRVVRFALSNSALVHCISSFIEKSAKESGARKTLIAPNGVYLSRFKNLNKKELKEKLGVGPGKIIITAGRLVTIKGIKYLIEAIPKVLKDGNNIKLLIIGDGPEKQRLINLSIELRLQNKIQFLGGMPQEEVFSYMIASDVFVGPSLVEGLGNVFIEAMACGLPIIGTKVGIPDIIEDNINGFLIPPGNSEAIAESILKILNDEALAVRLSQNGMAIVKEKFDWNKICEQIHSQYNSLIA